jgi:hypothetical protein
MGMSTILERQYRRTLRWYPSSWRSQHEDAVIGTLLDVAEGENRSRPRLGEQLNLAANGMLTRIGLFLPARVRDGVATVALATGTAFATVYFFFHDWAPWAAADRARLSSWNHDFGPFVNPGVIVCALWALGFVLALSGRHRITRIVLGVAILVGLAMPFINQLPFAGWSGPSSTDLGFFDLLAALSLVGTPSRRGRLVIGAGVALAALLAVYAYRGAFRPRYYLDKFLWGTPEYSWTLGPTLAVALFVAVCFAMARRGTTGAVIAISTLPWAAAWLVTIVSDGRPEYLVICIWALLILGFVAVGIAAVRRSGFELVIRRRDESR